MREDTEHGNEGNPEIGGLNRHYKIRLTAVVYQLGEYPEIVLEVPPQKEFGDFSTNIAMQSARVARQNPRAIAEALISHMNFDWLERAEVADAGSQLLLEI